MENNANYNFGDCVKYKKDKIIVCKANGRKFEGANNQRNEILYITLDNNGVNCLGFQGKTCDYLLINPFNEKAFFIELKGKNIKNAVSQLENSIREICHANNNYIKKKLVKKNAYAILSKYPKGDTNANKYKELLRKKYDTVLYIKNGIIRETLE